MVKVVTFFLSYFLVAYFVASVIGRGRKLDGMVRLLVGGGTLVAVASLIEWQTGTNLFNGLHRVIPILHYVDFGEHIERGTGFRALGSAQHPIALGAALVMLIPLTVYLHRRDRHVAWLVCGALLTLGALATGSRTGALMLIALLVSFVCIRPRETIRLLPWLLPLVIVIQVAMPGTLGTFKAILNPSYVIKEQSQDMGTGSGRIADIGPSLEEWGQAPFFGQGFGTRITSMDLGPGGVGDINAAQILDNQWLGTLLEVGRCGHPCIAVALLPCNPPTHAASPLGPGSRRLAGDRAGSGVGGFRGGHVHLRRLRVHSGDVPRVHHAGVRGSRDSRRGTRARSPLGGIASRFAGRGHGMKLRVTFAGEAQRLLRRRRA